MNESLLSLEDGLGVLLDLGVDPDIIVDFNLLRLLKEGRSETGD